MGTAFEVFDAGLKSQQEFLKNWTETRKVFAENWAESIKKMQGSFVSPRGFQEAAAGKDVFNLYASWVKTIVDSSRVFFDEVTKAQENWMKTQRVLTESWAESAKKMQGSFLSPTGSREGAAGNEIFSLYDSWVKTMISSSRAFIDEAVKLQKDWKSTVEKQTELSGKIAKNPFAEHGTEPAFEETPARRSSRQRAEKATNISKSGPARKRKK